MKKKTKNLKLNKKAIFYSTFVIITIVFLFGINSVRADWETPASPPPDSNIFVPLNVGPDKQAKEGNLLLDPLYNSYSTAPTVDYPLEVRGPNNVYINNLEILSEGELIVDLDTLYVDGENNQVGIGTLSPTSGAKLEISGGGFHIGQSGGGVSGIGLNVGSISNEELIYGMSTGINKASVYGLGIGDSIGVYGNNISSGSGIYAMSDSASAVVGATSKAYSAAGDIISGIYGSATGLGSWAGYFEQRLYVSDDIMGRKFVPNRLQDSQIPYAVGWKVCDIDASELINVSIMTFDGQYIWAYEGDWNDENIIVINPDNMEIVNRIDLGAGDHGVADMIDGGGYIWIAHNHNYGGGEYQTSVTRINPSEGNNLVTYAVQNPTGDSAKDSFPADLLYDDQTADGPYLWVLSILSYGDMHSITQMDMDGNVIKTFSFDAAANGGNKCSGLAMYGGINHCTDQLDNNMNGTADSGLCEYTAADSDACGGNNWAEGCTDRTFDNFTDCQNGGAIWATTCINDSCPTQTDCDTCGGAGVWDSDGGTCSDANCTTQATCEGTVSCSAGTWTAGDAQCVEGAPLGICSDPACTTWAECIGTESGQCSETVAATWAWNTASNIGVSDERIFDAYLGAPSGLTFDGAGNIWITFAGAPGYDNNTYAGEGYARFNATTPDTPANQYVYCSGPETRLAGIAYDVINDQMWVPFDTSTIHDNRGIAKISTGNGQVSQFLPFPTWPIGGQIKYFMGSPGGPSIWINDEYHALGKIDPNTNAVEHTYSFRGADFDFDESDPANPQILMTTASDAVILKHTMDDPPGYSTTTNVILGAIAQKLLFDGTNIWSSNYGTSTLTKYSAKGAVKLGVYDVGVNTENMIFDGNAIWIPFYENLETKYKRIDIVTDSIDEYILAPNIGNTYYTRDVVFDGKNIWQSVFAEGHSSSLTKVDLSSCDSDTKSCAVGSGYEFVDTSDGLVNLIFDGEYIWAFNHYENKMSKFSIDPTNSIILEAEITIAEISNDPVVDWHYSKMNVVEFDGTYIWVGAYNTDGDGNSIYKIDPKSTDIDDGYVGVCSNDLSSCNFDSECGVGNTCNAVVEDKYPVFHMPGSCSVSGDSCSQDSECPGTETCDGMWTRVTSLTFDGINMWATHEGFGDHSTTGNECADHLDNDGNGQCDFDGAAGYPGCSGKPDPGCDDADDVLERTGSNSEYSGSNRVLTRINVAKGEIIESVSISPTASGVFVYDAVFDGQNIWLGGTDFNGNTLVQFYSGSGFSQTDFGNTVNLQSSSLPGIAQSGSLSIDGAANFGSKLIVVNDLVVQNNIWGRASDNLRAYDTGCDDGEFAKGINNNTGELHCQPL